MYNGFLIDRNLKKDCMFVMNLVFIQDSLLLCILALFCVQRVCSDTKLTRTVFMPGESQRRLTIKKW